jgi:CheY-like chemotaxis protein
MTLAHRLIYVVDDDLSMRKAIGRLLESQDYSVEMFLRGLGSSWRGLPIPAPPVSFSI